MQRSTLCGLVAIALLQAIAGAESPLHYHSGDTFGRQRETTPGLPAGIIESEVLLAVDAEKANFAHFEFGQDRPPLIVAELKSDSGSTLYADINGDLRLTSDEALQKSQRGWTIDVQADLGREASRQTLLLNKSGDRFSIAAGGHLEGRVKIGDQWVEARVLDSNANGRFSDSDDRLLLDLDNNGKFSSLRERFASHGVQRIGGDRYTVGFAKGESALSLHRLTGTGYLIPKVPLADESAEVTEFEAELVSNGGVHISLNRLDSAAEVPVGTYRVARLRLEIHSKRKWSVGFEQLGKRSPSTSTVHVDKGETVEFDLLGKLALKAEIVNGSLASHSTITVQPSLTTSTGLYLNGARVGDIAPQDENRLTATLFDLRGNSERDLLAIEGTGFGCGQFCPITFDKTQRIGPASMVMLQFDSGPLVGKMIRTTSPTRPMTAPPNDNLDLQ